MARYSQTFSIMDIFNNRQLRNKLPIINYKEKTRDDGKISRRTNMKTVNRLVYDTALSASRPFFDGVQSTRGNNVMVISGQLKDEESGQDACVEAVYNALMGIKQVISFTANDAYAIRDALKIGEKSKRKGGKVPKLYLRVASIAQIQGMSDRQLAELMNNVMENLYYNDEFAEVRQKWHLDEQFDRSGRPYEVRKRDWERRVGIL